MAVNLRKLMESELLPVRGVALGVAEAAIKEPGRKDLLLITLREASRIAAVFTRNRFCAAPVIVAKQALRSGRQPRALLVNTGCANAGTGNDGVMRAQKTCDELARLLDCPPEAVLPFSTGVIMADLPVERIVAALPRCIADLREDNWLNAAHAIMTTDTVAKGACRQICVCGETITITGIAKGAGMIRPDLATMLAFIATDAAISERVLDACLRLAAARSFNRITVDGDTSTNDAFMLIATGQAKMREITEAGSFECKVFQQAVTEVAIELAHAIVRDGEGATKFIAITVERGADHAECERVAFAIAHSPLVKTALFASDPNLGRILAAIGRSGMDDVSQVKLYLGDVLVVENGARSPQYREQDGRRAVSGSDITVRVVLGHGDASITVWTCDFSYDYVRINAEYRS
jgi:glutamate N-acetyltransferase/amino-acid N-acetyltransferase